jgi:hypothetical protein
MSFLSAIKKLLGFSSTPTLQPGDRMLPCEDCNSSFVFDVGEQRFFKEKGFSEPKRCPKCRKKVRSRMRRRGGRGQGGGGGGHNPNQNHNQNNQHNQNQNQHHGRRTRHQGRRHSVIDGDSPYADER